MYKKTTTDEMTEKYVYRVYIVKDDQLNDLYVDDLDDETFMTLAEEEGNVYTLKGFQNAWNEDTILYPVDSYIRILKVKTCE